jgi:antiviral helicase SKI2
MLSATVPNYLEIAQWVGKIKNTTIYIQNTLKRVVPLEHKIFLDHDSVIMVKDKDSNVYEGNLDKAFKILKNKQKKLTLMSDKEKNAIKNKKNEFYNNITYFEKFQPRSKNKKRSNANNNNNNNTLKITNVHLLMDDLVNYLYDNKLNPAVIFVFSIKRINEYAKSLSLLNLVTKDEAVQIRNFFRKCIQTLPLEDRDISQIKEMEILIQNGIGVHHSGLLPILKEIVEIL